MPKPLLLCLLLLASTALAQPFWLEPAQFRVSAGTAIHIRRLIGENFQGRAWAGQSRRVTGFWHCAPGQPAAGLLATVTAADTLRTTLTLQQPGTHLIALTTDNAFTTMSAAEFTAYLKAQAFAYVLARRIQRADTVRPVREAYQRCAKTLVQAGAALPRDTARAWARVLQLPLELVPEQNPYALVPGAAFTVRVLRAGQPLAGQPVALWRRNGSRTTFISKLSSNQNGRVLFRLSEAGEYLASTVRMEPAPLGLSADWQSIWSTLSFGLMGKKPQ